MKTAAFLGALLLAAPASCLLPQHGWATLSEQIFYHSSNISGPFTDGANAVIAKHQMVTIEKWMDWQNGEDEADNIVNALKSVKALNPNITTIFYTSTVCNFPQYKSMYEQFHAMPENWLRNNSNEPIVTNCAGWKDLHAFDMGKQVVRDLWVQLCLNATAAGADGCFVDRILDGYPANLSNPVQYQAGHLQAVRYLQEKIGPEKIILANHAYTMEGVNSALIEFCSPSEDSIVSLQQCKANKKICECHSTTVNTNYKDTGAAYLIGAYSGEGYASYFGFGPWRATTEFNEAWANATIPDWFNAPIGAPLGDAVKEGDVWKRSFQHANVTFNTTSNTGNVSTW